MFNRLNWRCLLVSSFSFFSHGFFALGNRPSRWLSPWGPTCRTTGRSMTTRPFTAAPSPSTSAISYISRYHIYTVISLSSSSFFSFLFSPCTHKHEAYKRRLVIVSQSPLPPSAIIIDPPPRRHNRPVLPSSSFSLSLFGSLWRCIVLQFDRRGPITSPDSSLPSPSLSLWPSITSI